MTENHPTTPPPELIEQWMQDHTTKYDLARHAARWGADQELEACCEWIPKWTPWDVDQLRAARRPKPPSLKEEALAALDDAIMRGDCITISDALPTIRRALEALPE
jgi:hypothetical protein